jgi:N-acyl-D-amino-acid deacylase
VVGKAADVVMFDHATIEERATYVDPHAFSTGIPYVMVNGALVVDNNVQTDAFPG